jgi:hypothetical protein
MNEMMHNNHQALAAAASPAIPVNVNGTVPVLRFPEPSEGPLALALSNSESKKRKKQRITVITFWNILLLL